MADLGSVGAAEAGEAAAALASMDVEALTPLKATTPQTPARQRSSTCVVRDLANYSDGKIIKLNLLI